MSNKVDSLTPSQLKAKARVEKNGGVFVHPSKYSQHSVARRSAKKSYPNIYKSLTPEVGSIVDQILDPESSNDTSRYPNTYGLSAVYKCKNVINAQFSVNNNCSVVVYPRLKNAIFTTVGSSSSGDVPEVTGSPQTHPFSVQHFSLQPLQVTPWSEPIYFSGGSAILPFPNVATGKLLYPVTFSSATATDELTFLSQVPVSYSGQFSMTIAFYASDFTLVHSETQASNNVVIVLFLFLNLK